MESSPGPLTFSKMMRDVNRIKFHGKKTTSVLTGEDLKQIRKSAYER